MCYGLKTAPSNLGHSSSMATVTVLRDKTFKNSEVMRPCPFITRIKYPIKGLAGGCPSLWNPLLQRM